MAVRHLSRSRSSAVALGALATLTAGLVVLAPGAGANPAAVVSITSVVTGAAPFSAADGIGQDSSSGNARVRAGDPVTFGVRVVPGGQGSGLTDTSVTVDVVAGKGSVTWSAALPEGCVPGADPGTVQCDLGPRQINQGIDLTFSGTASERSAAGDLTTTLSVSSDGTAVTTPLVVTAAALTATPVFTEPRLEGPATVDGVDGLVFVYGLHVAAPAATAMVSDPAGTTFSSVLDVSGIPGASVLACSANGADDGVVAYSAAVSEARTALDADAAALVASGGTWACTPEGQLTITGVDTNPDSFPTTAWDRTPLDPTADVLSSGAVRVFVPASTIGGGVTLAIVAGPLSAPSAVGAGTTRQDNVTAERVGDATPGLLVIHTVNGVLAPEAPGAAVAVDATVHYAATVINTGDVALTGLTAADSAVADLALVADGPLAPGASWTFDYDAVQPDGSLVSTLTVTGAAGDADVSGTDVAQSSVPVADPLSLPAPGATPAATGTKFELTVFIDGQEFTALPGPIAIIGAQNLVEYEVKNISGAAVSNVVVEDSSITNDASAIDCGDDATTKNKITSLALGETVTCSQVVQPTSTTAVTFTATVSVNSVVDVSLNAGYQTKTGSVDLELNVNGQDADTTPGVTVVTGAVLTFSYVLRNTGQVDLATVEIAHENDDNGDFADIACASLGADTDNDAVIDLIKPGESVNCTFSPTAVAGLFTTKAVAVGNPVAADETVLENLDGAIEVTDSDAVFYTGSTTGGTTGTTVDPTLTTATGTIGNGGANSGPLALVSGLVFLAGFGLWGVSRRRRFAR